MADNTNTPDEKLRGSIATKILMYGTIALGVVAVTLIIGALAVGTDKDKSIAIVANVFNALLPVIATWVGTVIAFYFGKENFAAASKSVQDMVTAMTSDQKLKSISAKDKNAIIPVSDIKYYKYTTEAEIAALKLSEVMKFMNMNAVMRLPFIDSSNVVKYCIHRSIFDKYIALIAFNSPDLKITDLTFGDFLKSTLDDIHVYVNSSVEYVKEESTLYDVKLIMDNNSYCEDVFLTKNGKKEEPVMGWITNDKILENTKV